MWSFAKFVVLCLVAAAVGLAAVSLPIGGKTPAEYVRALLETHANEEAAAQARPSPAPSPPPAGKAERRSADRVTPSPAADRPPADNPTDEDRAALEKLLGERIR